MIDYKEKYEQAIERLKQWDREHPNGYAISERDEFIFPELAESEDERTMKEIVLFLREGKPYHCPNSAKRQEWAAWLEKQGEQKHTAEEILIKAGLKPYKDGDQWCVLLGDNIQEGICGFGNTIEDALYAFLEDLIASQGEQKSADKFESKFKVGDWVVFNNKHQSIYQVEKIEDGYYILRHTHGGTFRVCVLHDESLRLWSIKDAKVGDVLACNEEILLFKSYSIQGRISLYCWYNGQTNNFHSKEVVETLVTTRNKICPATKEQRDQLEKAIADAGYTFDFEKKELKKIVVPIFNIGDAIIKKHNSDIHDFGSFTITDIADGKYWYNDRIICDITKQDEWELYEPVIQTSVKWSKEDETYLDHVFTAIKAYYSDDKGHENPWRDELLRWLNDLEERVGCEVNCTTTKEWSEEDGQVIEDAETWLDTLCDYLKDSSSECIPTVKEVISKLKSLKKRVQPQPKQEWSEEDESLCRQIEGILSVCRTKSLLSFDLYKKMLDLLKSIKDRVQPQSQWKPSDEQMNALNDVISSRDIKYDVLSELWKDLKKLREE